MSIRSDLVFYSSYADANSKRYSASLRNDSYREGFFGVQQTGIPDIRWDRLVFVGDRRLLWTHGIMFYCSSAVDLVLSITSQNAVSNSAVTRALNGKMTAPVTLTEDEFANATKDDKTLYIVTDSQGEPQGVYIGSVAVVTAKDRITVDSELDLESTNPVENRAITAAITEINETVSGYDSRIKRSEQSAIAAAADSAVAKQSATNAQAAAEAVKQALDNFISSSGDIGQLVSQVMLNVAAIKDLQQKSERVFRCSEAKWESIINDPVQASVFFATHAGWDVHTMLDWEDETGAVSGAGASVEGGTLTLHGTISGDTLTVIGSVEGDTLTLSTTYRAAASVGAEAEVEGDTLTVRGSAESDTLTIVGIVENEILTIKSK